MVWPCKETERRRIAGGSDGEGSSWDESQGTPKEAVEGQYRGGIERDEPTGNKCHGSRQLESSHQIVKPIFMENNTLYGESKVSK